MNSDNNKTRNEPFKKIARRYETGKIGFYDALYEANQLDTSAPPTDHIDLEAMAEKLFYEGARLET